MIKSFLKSVAGVSVLAITLVGGAQAQTDLTVEVSYDKAALTTEAGADAVLKSISRQAIQNCRSVSLVSSGFFRDEACELEVIRKAVQEIGAETLAEAYAGSDYYIDAPETGVVLAQN